MTILYYRDQDTHDVVSRKIKIASLTKELQGCESELSHATNQKSQLEYNRKKEESNLHELRYVLIFLTIDLIKTSFFC